MIGLESYFVCGDTHAVTGGYMEHWWSVIIDGMEHVFDAQINDNIA